MKDYSTRIEALVALWRMTHGETKEKYYTMLKNEKLKDEEIEEDLTVGMSAATYDTIRTEIYESEEDNDEIMKKFQV